MDLLRERGNSVTQTASLTSVTSVRAAQDLFSLLFPFWSKSLKKNTENIVHAFNSDSNIRILRVREKKSEFYPPFHT